MVIVSPGNLGVIALYKEDTIQADFGPGHRGPGQGLDSCCLLAHECLVRARKGRSAFLIASGRRLNSVAQIVRTLLRCWPLSRCAEPRICKLHTWPVS